MSLRDEIPASPLAMDELEPAVRSILPQARAVDIQIYDPATGEFQIAVTLPTRIDQATITIRRFSLNDLSIGERIPDPDPESPERGSFGGQSTWGFYVDYDPNLISMDEVRVLVGRPLVRDPVLAYPRS